jgi:hypothetical protein
LVAVRVGAQHDNNRGRTLARNSPAHAGSSCGIINGKLLPTKSPRLTVFCQ